MALAAKVNNIFLNKITGCIKLDFLFHFQRHYPKCNGSLVTVWTLQSNEMFRGFL